MGRRSIIILMIFAILLNLTLPVMGKDDKKSKDSMSDEKLRRFMYFYKEKNAYLAVCYSMLFPGMGNLYAGRGSHFLTTWLIIGTSFLAYKVMPNETDEEKELAENVLVYGVGIGYCYTLITSWYDTTARNRKLRKDVSDKDKLQSDIFLVKGRRGDIGLLLKLSKTF